MASPSLPLDVFTQGNSVLHPVLASGLRDDLLVSLNPLARGSSLLVTILHYINCLPVKPLHSGGHVPAHSLHARKFPTLPIATTLHIHPPCLHAPHPCQQNLCSSMTQNCPKAGSGKADADSTGTERAGTWTGGG